MNYMVLILLFCTAFVAKSQVNEQSSLNVEILEYADRLLNSPENWTKEGEFKICKPSHQYSLQCALIEASIKVNDRYSHRGLASRTLRKTIQDEIPFNLKHPIYDFNNLESTTFLEVKEILKKAITKLKN